MEIAQKVKLALDETRMLNLGAQILLGFQLRGVFSEGYDQLPANARYLDGLALGLMVCVVGLLILPGPYHRVVMEGEDDPHFHRLVTAVADLALFPSRSPSALMSSSPPGGFWGIRQAPPLASQPPCWPSVSGTVSRGCGNGMSDGKSAR
jgi:Family of unknown function (DUF6328)